MSNDNVSEVTAWPVNEKGEILLQAGTGTTNKVGDLPSVFIPTDETTSKVSVKLSNGVGNTPFINPTGSVSGPVSNLLQVPTFNFSGSVTRNFGSAFSAWGDFNAVQLVFLNHNATASTIDNHVVGASATAFPGGVFNIAAPTSGWSAPAGSVTVPAAIGANQTERNKRPGIALGPKIALRSIPRAAGEADNGKYPLLFTRVLVLQGNATTPMNDLGNNFPTLYDPQNEGYSILTAAPVSNVDYTSTNTAGWNTSSRETLPGCVTFGAVFTYDQAFTTVMGIGDSIMAGGADGSSQRAPWLFKAVSRIRSSGKLAGFYNGAISGSTIEQINGHGKDMIAAFKPNIIVLAPYTINSPISTQANWDTQWQQTMDLVQTAQTAGIRVVLTTPIANDSFSTAQNSYRMVQMARVKNSGLPYIDLESLAVSSTGRFASSTYTTDGVHLTPAGNEMVASLAQPVIAAMIA